MNTYIATFYTHAGALLSNRNLKETGIISNMMPVPRKLSSSCGTCVKYDADSPMRSCMDSDLEEIYQVMEQDYRKIEY